MKRFLSIILCLSLIFTLVAQTTVFGDPSEDVALAANDSQAADSGWTRGMEGTYDYPIYPDAYHMSDEDVFGVWSKEEGVWITEPKFDYSKWTEMTDVENAAKEGDYPKAKDALLEYYRGVVAKGRVEGAYSSSVSASAENISKVLSRNFYPAIFGPSTLENLFEVDNDMEERRIDVLTGINAGKGSWQYYGVTLASVDQETTAEFMTKEGGFTSYLSLVVNGLSVEIPVAADTYISAGTNAGTNFGSEPTMLSAEGITREYKNSDENTKRAMVKFDISSLEKSDSITSATLVIKGKNASGTGRKEMVLYRWGDNSYSEDTVCWSSFAEHWMFSCNSMDSWDYVTSSSTQIKGKICFMHRGDTLANPANAYAISGNEDYAYEFIRQQMALQYHLGFNLNVMNELDMTTHTGTTLTSVFRTINSEHMTGERFTAMFKHLWTISRWICEEYYGQRSNNYATFATAAGYKFVSYFKEITDYDLWLANTQNENERVQGKFLRADGTSVELARGYQATLLSTLKTPINTQNNLGNEDAPFTDYTVECIRTLLHDFAYSAAPGFGGWGFGDGADSDSASASAHKTHVTDFYSKLFNSDDEIMEYVVTDGKSGVMPEHASMSFPYGLRTYLRTDWSDKAVGLAFTAKGELNSSHGDSDLLTVVVHAYGQYLLTDSQYASILTDGPNNFKVQGSALRHNTITSNGEDHVNDNQGHAATEGKEIEVELNSIHDFVTYAADDAIKTAQKFRRSVAFMRDAEFWVVSDYIEQNNDYYNDYSQQWSMHPNVGMILDTETGLAISNNPSGPNIQVVPVSPEKFTYIQEQYNFYSPASSVIVDMPQATYHKKTNAPKVTYTTILVPSDIGVERNVEVYELSTGLDADDASCVQIKVTDDEGQEPRNFFYYHLNDNTNQQDVTVGKYSTDATTLMLEEATDGTIVSAMLLNATYLKAEDIEDEYIFKSEAPLKSIAFKSNGAVIDVASSTLTMEELLNTTFFDFERYQAVWFDGTDLDTKSANGYLYFGDEPIVEGTPDDDEGSKPSGGGGGGGSSSGGSSGGASSGGLGSVTGIGHAGGDKVVVVPEKEEEPDIKPVTPSYTDVSADDWYFECVEELTENGVVSGDGTGKFNPSDNVTREQFLKMLIEASGIETIEAENTFADVADAWYKPYVLKAKNFGIVNGISDTKFGVGSNITRQDMAVMISRTIDKLGLQIDTEEVDIFADDAKVSDYAKESVTYMKSIGLIEGYNNEYRPHGNLTRAEAAKVISELLKLI